MTQDKSAIITGDCVFGKFKQLNLFKRI